MMRAKGKESLRGAKTAGAVVAAFVAAVMAVSADWPQWRGPNGSGVASPEEHVFSSWPGGGVTQLWQSADYSSSNNPCGSPIAAEGRVYAVVGDNTLVCLDAADGAQVWKSPHLGVGDAHNTPCLYRGRVYASISSGSSPLHCIESDGSIRWTVESVGQEVGAKGLIIPL